MLLFPHPTIWVENNLKRVLRKSVTPLKRMYFGLASDLKTLHCYHWRDMEMAPPIFLLSISTFSGLWYFFFFVFIVFHSYSLQISCWTYYLFILSPWQGFTSKGSSLYNFLGILSLVGLVVWPCVLLLLLFHLFYLFIFISIFIFLFLKSFQYYVNHFHAGYGHFLLSGTWTNSLGYNVWGMQHWTVYLLCVEDNGYFV